MTKITTKLETVTPDHARRFMQNNHKNRALKQGLVDLIAKDITRGDFKVTHQGIAIDTDGNLLDGQHRCSAIIKANKAVQILVTRGLPPESMNVIDIGAKRSQGDALAILGYENATTLATAASLYQSFLDLSYSFVMRERKKMNNFELQAFIESHPELVRNVRLVLGNQRLKTAGYPSAVSALYSLFHRINKDAAVPFFTAMADNFSAERHHPAIILNEHLLRRRANGTTINRIYFIAAFIKAWEAFLSKKYTSNFIITDANATVRNFLEKTLPKK